MLQICLCGLSDTNHSKLHANVGRPNFLFVKPSVEVSARYQQEVLAFPPSLLSVRAQPQHKRQRHPEMGLDVYRSSAGKVNQCDQSARGCNEESHVTRHNAGVPVPCLTIYNPLSVVSVTRSLAGPYSIHPSVFVIPDEQQ